MLPDKSTYSIMGGELVDYQPAEDPTTDLPAVADDENRADCAAMTRTITRAYVAFTTNGTTCTVVDHDAVWGNGLAVAPTVARSSAGTFVVTWPATVTDARGLSHALNLRRGLAEVEPDTNVYVARAKIASPNTAQVVTSRSSTEAAADPSSTAAIVVTVW